MHIKSLNLKIQAFISFLISFLFNRLLFELITKGQSLLSWADKPSSNHIYEQSHYITSRGQANETFHDGIYILLYTKYL